MQKLLVEFKNAPRDASQVPCSASLVLNRPQRVSVQGIQLANNNPEENLPGNKGDALMVAFVLNKKGKPLMPCTATKAKHLLRQGKVKVVKCNPFTIQWLYGSGTTVQPILLGIDPGYTHIGFSATTDKQELMSGEVRLRTNISQRLTDRRMYRRNRRSRLWHREPRWNNRVSTKKQGWLAPSIQHRLNSHIRLITKLKKLLPISDSNIMIEVANFDTQKMQNPEISGIEYQQGTLQGYETREYLLDKFSRKCAYCKKTDIPLEIEHIIPKSRGGTDRISNLTLACHKCNQKKGNRTAKEFGHPTIQKQANQTLSLKATAYMNNIRWKIVNTLNCQHTYGYITKHDRIKQDLPKTHRNDAFVIAGGNGQQTRTQQYIINQIRRNNRKLQVNRKGYKPSIRRQKYSLHPHDLVRWDNQILSVKGVHCKGDRVVLDNSKSVKIETVDLYKYAGGGQFLCQLKQAVSLPVSL